jgi:hypothetical protein
MQSEGIGSAASHEGSSATLEFRTPAIATEGDDYVVAVKGFDQPMPADFDGA